MRMNVQKINFKPMQKIIFPYHGESSEKMDVKIFCKMITAMQMSGFNSERTSLADAYPAEEGTQLLQPITHDGRTGFLS